MPSLAVPPPPLPPTALRHFPIKSPPAHPPERLFHPLSEAAEATRLPATGDSSRQRDSLQVTERVWR
ncbi:hypothetical protein E2C01_085847 [Portunus trituberculatus]|uniref:Uncharacterized protein n=1 Tax=Portunus trituberculatus TaxID=210409 RepID=A0A5B7JER6_PORTR|nr:hypothetical protein [Portunus trituberculatus]